MTLPLTAPAPSRQPPPMAAKLVKRLPHMSILPGRPWRFEPGPALRRLGFKGHYLIHDDGKPYDDREAEDWVNATLLPKITAARAAAEAAASAPPPPANQRRRPSSYHVTRPAAAVTVADLFQSYFTRPELNGRATVEGRMKRKPLAAKTVEGYRKAARPFENFEPFWMAPAAAIRTKDVNRMLERIEAAHGLHMARYGRALLSTIYAKCGEAHDLANPVTGARRLPVPEGRVRPATRAEILHLVNTADEARFDDGKPRPDVGDMILFGVLTAQRQADRLTLTHAEVKAGRLHFRQSKTGKAMSLALDPVIAARLAAARERRKAHTVQWPHLFIDEQAQKPWHPSGDHYRHVFARVRAEAAKDMPSVADLRDQDLRDTAVTWMAAKGLGFETRRMLTGHSASSRKLEADHYLQEQASAADEAVAALGAMLREEET